MCSTREMEWFFLGAGGDAAALTFFFFFSKKPLHAAGKSHRYVPTLHCPRTLMYILCDVPRQPHCSIRAMLDSQFTDESRRNCKSSDVFISSGNIFRLNVLSHLFVYIQTSSQTKTKLRLHINRDLNAVKGLH